MTNTLTPPPTRRSVAAASDNANNDNANNDNANNDHHDLHASAPPTSPPCVWPRVLSRPADGRGTMLDQLRGGPRASQLLGAVVTTAAAMPPTSPASASARGRQTRAAARVVTARAPGASS